MSDDPSRAARGRVSTSSTGADRADLDSVGCARPGRADAGRCRATSLRCTSRPSGSARRSTWPATDSARAVPLLRRTASRAVVAAARTAFWPHLLPIARDWSARLGRAAPWPDDLDEWLGMCHAAGQTRPTPLMLRYGPGDWNALHRDLYGELVFPLQVVISLNDPGVDHTGGEFVRLRATPAGPVPRHRHRHPPRPRPGVHHPRPSRAISARGGRPHLSDTVFRPSGPAPDSPLASSSTTPPDGQGRCAKARKWRPARPPPPRGRSSPRRRAERPVAPVGSFPAAHARGRRRW